MAKTLRSSVKDALNRSIKGDLLSPTRFLGSTLDLDFAGTKSLKNAVDGKNLVTHTRASSATYVDGDGVVRTAVTNHIRNSEDLNAAGWNRAAAGTAVAPVVTALQALAVTVGVQVIAPNVFADCRFVSISV